MDFIVWNYTLVTEFTLLGFPTCPELQIVLFLLFLTLVDLHLQTPMYFFLSNLSFVDLCYSSVFVPKMLVNFLSQNKSISHHGCVLQFYFFCTFTDTESFILVAMAYDGYVAICNPLLYMAVMSRGIFIWLIFLSYFGGNMSSLVHTSFAFILKYYTSLNEWLLSTYGSSVEIICFIVIIIYFYILLSVLKIHSSTGRKKTFSTCGTLLFVYSRPSYLYSPNTGKIISVFYTIIIPMLNLLIYSLRNKDVKDASKKSLKTKDKFLLRHKVPGFT
ncbi:hypothetical protein FD754_001526 [Muntiacus muntjak]|uniref:G-protein coupled receptors family 1 profile domain-containing protein n=1 Tax=Muntiacus muntjak TaxID=9888 RepID=A0A5N3W6Q5_MUNMU|nr:hypothetical protein FD754_001526 [Muntiacus muntjak]